METAKPCLLEPIMKVEIEAPDEFAGTLMAISAAAAAASKAQTPRAHNINQRPGPMAEMLTYGTLLTSMTQGKGKLPHGMTTTT